MNELISIIIPTFNRAHLITATLDSIIEQEYSLWECIVVDDGSIDDTESIVLTYAAADNRIKFYSRPADIAKGAPNCRNFGYEKSSGTYIQWFDSDDIMLPEMLREKVQVLEGKPESDFVVSKMGTFSKIDHFEFKDYPISSENLIEDYLLYKVYFLTPGPLFKKSYLGNQHKLFDPTLVKHQEWEFYSRLLLTGGRGIFLHKFHCVRRMHNESIKALTENNSQNVIEKNKFSAVLRLNENTGYEFKKQIAGLFNRRIATAVVRYTLRLDFMYALLFLNTLFILNGLNLNILSRKGD